MSGHGDAGETGRDAFQKTGRDDATQDMGRDPKAHPKGNAEKDPDTWTTGSEPMTGAQASYLKTLSEEADEPFEPGLSKAEASKRIEALQERTGRGT